MVHIELNGKWLDLGEVDGFIFAPREHAPDSESIVIPREVAISVTVHIPDDAPIWRLPPILAANAPNN